jgi:hypothetical protein
VARKYEYGVRDVPHTNNVRSAHSTGLKNGHKRHRASYLSNHRWEEGSEGDWSLYDKDGLTVARIVGDKLDNPVDDRYRLRSPIAHPRLWWRGLEQAKRGAETVALWALPNRKRDVGIANRPPVAGWYDRLDGSSDYYDDTGAHTVRLIWRGKAFHLAKPAMAGGWQDRAEAKEAALKH